jgi:hypothetical protein
VGGGAAADRSRSRDARSATSAKGGSISPTRESNGLVANARASSAARAKAWAFGGREQARRHQVAVDGPEERGRRVAQVALGGGA